MSGFDETGTLDAAVLLLALGEETAAEVFKHLSPKEVQCLGEVMAKASVAVVGVSAARRDRPACRRCRSSTG